MVSKIDEYIWSLKAASRLSDQVVFHRVFPAETADFTLPDSSRPVVLASAMGHLGIRALFSHQATGGDLVRAGRHTVVATPTASGKTLIYNLSVLSNYLLEPSSRALYIFPLKALAQDQKKTFERFAAACPPPTPTAAIYDGDTTAWHRKKIKQAPPNVLITNPEMLHLSLLPYHHQWVEFYKFLKIIVIDEVHIYRGVMGSHMAQVFRRLLRICRHYGAAPIVVFCSATVGNPGTLSEQLTGLSVTAVTKSGAPRGKRHLVLVDPVEGPARMAIQLLKAALHRGLRTIVYAKSRKMTELIALWASSQAGKFAERISAYRAGFLPEERREIEAKLSSGELLAVISTSALELGIDIGALDLCLLVGYPGTTVSTWQRGGRVGRGGQDSALILIAGEDALDRYFLQHPAQLYSQAPESAVVNPENRDILYRHLPCAAAELPLTSEEPLLQSEVVQSVVRKLVTEGPLLAGANGKQFYSHRKMPHRHVDLRGAGNRYRIVSEEDGEYTGEIDEYRAFRETHPGAVYLHKGETYLVNRLDTETRTVVVAPGKMDYYTRVMGRKNTEILEIEQEKSVLGTFVGLGRLKVTDQVTGYETWRIRGNKRLNRFALDLPPQIFETTGLWIKIPAGVQDATERNYLHFMGGIHAVEHAAIGIFPLLVMTDRNDLGGISTPFHPQIGGPVIFIYDAVPGGAGLSTAAYNHAEALFSHTLNVIADCPCKTGCPACVHSPKCGSGNRPIDKAAALFVMRQLNALRHIDPAPASRLEMAPSPMPPKPACIKPRIKRKKPMFRPISKAARPAVSLLRDADHFCVFDLETQRSAKEVGGWHRADLMRISCGVVYDSKTADYHVYLDHQVPELIAHLQRTSLVIGFNIERFDYTVLSGYSDVDFGRFNTLDLLTSVYRQLGYRLSLDHLATATLNAKKTADGLQALQWWKEGEIEKIVTYCKKDVEITTALYEYGRANGFLLFNNKAGQTVRVPVDW